MKYSSKYELFSYKICFLHYMKFNLLIKYYKPDGKRKIYTLYLLSIFFVFCTNMKLFNNYIFMQGVTKRYKQFVVVRGVDISNLSIGIYVC